MRLRETQQEIARALLDPDQPVPAGVIRADGLTSARRFGVYRNNVTVSLINALREAFPVCERVIGSEAFREVARQFARKHPPPTPVLLRYGAGFAEFLEAFEPFQKRPYLGDVARLERARLSAYHAADAEPVAADILGQVPPDRLATLRMQPHPALRIVRSSFPIVTVWAMNSDIEPLGPVDFSRAEAALVTRADMSVEIRRLRPGGYEFACALRDGETFQKAASVALAAAADFDLGATLGDLLAAGAFQSVQLQGDD